MSNIAFLFLPLAFSSLPAVLPFVSPSSQVLPVPLEVDHIAKKFANLPVAFAETLLRSVEH